MDHSRDEPWRASDAQPISRADSLLAVMTEHDKQRLAIGDLQPLARFGVPELHSSDGPNGVALTGTTMFPSGFSLASTFSRDLARRFGAAVARELRGKGRSVWLGPSVDIARAPLGGRQVESFGEDPLLAGSMARAAVEGARSEHTIQTLKHFVANNQEHGRTGHVADDGVRTPGIDVRISDRALREIYVAPFRPSLEPGGAGAVMGSYNRVNGTQACENAGLISLIKSDWPGIFVPDYEDAIRDQAAAIRAGVDLPQFDQGSGGREPRVAASDSIGRERLDDIARRTLWAIFDSGIFDDPAPDAQEMVRTPEHRLLASEISRRGMVLLRNKGVLPLPRSGSIALIGPAGADAFFTTGGSAGIDPAPGSLSTPVEAITDAAGAARVLVEQGSPGDVPAETAIPVGLLRTDAGTQGWDAQFWNNGSHHGAPVLTRVDVEIDLPGPPSAVHGNRYSARWRTALTPSETGVHHFTSLHAGVVSLRIGDREVLAGVREATRFARGPVLPVSGSIALTAGEPVEVLFEYSSRTALFAPAVALHWRAPSESRIAEAVGAANTADVAVVLANVIAGEGADRTSLSLPGDQNDLIRAVAEANPRTVVVLNVGGPVQMPWVDDVAAVIAAWYPGETFGAALAALLFGDAEPAGRLPITFPISEERTAVGAGGRRRYPGIDDVQVYDEDILVGWRWHQAAHEVPLFPFGHGLSYTDFAFTDFAVERIGTDVVARVTVTNAGRRDGTAVPQLYLTQPSRADRAFAPNVLAGFETVDLPIGGSAIVAIPIPRSMLSFWDEIARTWTEELEGRAVWIGVSSDSPVTEAVDVSDLFR